MAVGLASTQITACRQQGERQQAELRAWLDDLRLERQRLEERLLSGGACAAQETRADIEAAVQRLSRDRAALGSEVAALQLEQQQQNEFVVRPTPCGGLLHVHDTACTALDHAFWERIWSSWGFGHTRHLLPVGYRLLLVVRAGVQSTVPSSLALMRSAAWTRERTWGKT